LVKDMVEIATFARKLTRSGLARMLRAELMIEHRATGGGLRGSGMIIVNPPWKLHDELSLLLPALRQTLAGRAEGGLTLDWLLGETSR
jgi:23S rRNA (adenine2030-N6)-methyltransferase